MGLIDLFDRTVLSIDNSTQSCAWALWKGKKLVDYGEVEFTGKNTYERLVGMADALKDLKAKCQKVNIICIEKTAFVQSKQTAILMGMAAGAVISHIANANTKILEIPATTWQSYIGNGTLTAKEKRAVKDANPSKNAAWLKNEYRRIRKQRTMDFVKETFGIEVANDNQGDSIALGFYYVSKF